MIKTNYDCGYKTVTARLKPDLVSIINKGKAEGYSEAEIVREGIRLFNKKLNSRNNIIIKEDRKEEEIKR